ncbi:plectin-like [Astyanax mexicanus]|uniref:Plectin-like n=1 Tax=Astyanax mexicanus TaxID=7994 RepID=A0A8T2MAS7_ASTMX|nr:plectin-like [Astyanax mexicanus]
MDALQDWALAHPAPARLLWVMVLVLATLVVWSFFFCCWDVRSVSPLETYLAVAKKSSKLKHQNQRKKKPKDKTVTSALVNDGIVGMISLAATPTLEKQKITEEKKEKKQVEDVKTDKKGKQEKKKQVEDVKKDEKVKQEKKKQVEDNKEKEVEEIKEENKVQQKEKQVEKLKEEKKQAEEEKPATVRKRNKRHLKVTIAPGTVTSEPAEKAMSRPRLRERSASEESPSELSASPLPGDTLPWNLAKHQRVKRSKSASGDVLDPAERAVIRIAGKKLSEHHKHVLLFYFLYN